MRADEPYIDYAIGIVDPYDDAILIAGDIEHHSTVFENAGGANFALDHRRGGPVGCFDLSVPCHHWLVCVGMSGAPVEKGLERGERNDPHATIHSKVPNWDQDLSAVPGPTPAEFCLRLIASSSPMVISSASALPRVLRRTPERQIRHRPLKPPVQAIYTKGHVILGAGREPQESDSAPTCSTMLI